VTTDLTLASLNINTADSLSADPERLLLIHADAWSSRFETDLEAAAQLITPTVVSTDVVSKQWDLDLTLDVPDELEITKDSSVVEQLMCLGVTLPPPIERPPVGISVVPVDDPAPQLAGETSIQPRTELPSPIPLERALNAVPSESLAGIPRPESTEPLPVDESLPDLETPQLPKPRQPAIRTPSQSPAEEAPADSPRFETVHAGPKPEPTLPASAETPEATDAPLPEIESTATVDLSAGYASATLNESRTQAPTATPEPTHSGNRIPQEPRTELSEIVRHVRTMVVEQETRSTIQMEPAELGRMTVELVEAPEGLRAYVSAEDPTVLRFLERNIQLLESEARLQGVGNMSFSVGADVSGGLGRGDQRQSEAEASFRRSSEWNTAPPAKPRSRRELDTNA
jgi:flagellar hook-length control protein FliK